jgi:hypothetical protein
MDELTLLQEFRAAVTPPDDAVLARARASMLDGRTAGPGRHARYWHARYWHARYWHARGPRLPGIQPRLALTGLAAAVAAAAIAVTLTDPGHGQARPAVLTVKELAYRAATAAAAQPEVSAGQWVYWRETTTIGGRSTYQVWTTADSGNAAWFTDGKLQIQCPHQAEVATCQMHDSVGQPWEQTIGQPLVGSGALSVMGPIPVSYSSLESLPANPVALDRYLASLPATTFLQLPPSITGTAVFPAPAREFTDIEDLLISYQMPPTLTAELYRALGDIPGVTVNDRAIDAAGRSGLGFQFTMPPGHYGSLLYYPPSDGPYHSVTLQLILDPRTYQWMGYGYQGFCLTCGQKGSVTGAGTAVLQSALVSGPGVMP